MPRARKKPPLQLRVKSTMFQGTKIIKIDAKGVLPPDSLHKNLEFMVSLFDSADRGVHPILSTEKIFQEAFSAAFESRVKIGFFDSSNRRFDQWMPVAVVPEEILAGPYTGKRTVVAAVRLVDADVDAFSEGGDLICEEESVFWEDQITFVCNKMPYGYVKFGKRRRRLESITLKIGLAVAMADGEYDAEEQFIVMGQLNRWIEASMAQYDGLTTKKCRPSYRAMLSRALKKTHENELDPNALIKSLERQASEPQWADALNFCYKIMAANGIPDLNQLRLLRRIVAKSYIENKIIDKIKDQTILHLNLTDMAPSHMLELLCIDSQWPKDRIRTFLRHEYKKWNGRLNTIPEGMARQNAQAILNIIGKAYKKYSPPKPKPSQAEPAQPTLKKAPPSPPPIPDPDQLELF